MRNRCASRWLNLMTVRVGKQNSGQVRNNSVLRERETGRASTWHLWPGRTNVHGPVSGCTAGYSKQTCHRVKGDINLTNRSWLGAFCTSSYTWHFRRGVLLCAFATILKNILDMEPDRQEIHLICKINIILLYDRGRSSSTQENFYDK